MNSGLYVVMRVSGAGKTLIGETFARKLAPHEMLRSMHAHLEEGERDAGPAIEVPADHAQMLVARAAEGILAIAGGLLRTGGQP